MRNLPLAPAGSHPRIRLPYLSAFPHKAVAGARPLQPQSLSPQGSNLEQLTNFAGSSIGEDIGFFGNDQAYEPPDTQIAAGYDSVVEMVNTTITARSKSGTILAAADLNVFFGVPIGYSFSDPIAFFDQGSGRWFASGAAFDSKLNSQVYIAMSTGSDPSQRWTITPIAVNTSQIAFDQPKLGVTADKVLLTWNDFSCPTTSNCSFQHSQIALLDKSDMLAGKAPRAFFYTTPWFAVVPAVTLAGTGEAYIVFYDPTGIGAEAGVMQFTGSPASGGVANSEDDWPVPIRSEPPDAVQQGSTTLIRTGDSRVESAVYRNGRLIASQTIGCQPSGDSMMRACGVVVELKPLFLGGANTATDLVVLNGNNTYFYYPAVMTDAADNLYTVATESSGTIFPGAVVTAFLAGNPGAFTQTFLATGTQSYDTSTSCSGGNYWGDYSGIAADPVDPDDVWLAGELAVGGPIACPSGGWSTQVGRFTYAAPAIAGASPIVGSTRGGAQVTITGSDFDAAGMLSVKFGSIAAQSVQALSPDKLTAVTPAEAAGSVPITVTTLDGTGNGPQFTFIDPAVRGATLQGTAGPAPSGRQPAPPGSGYDHPHLVPAHWGQVGEALRPVVVTSPTGSGLAAGDGSILSAETVSRILRLIESQMGILLALF